MGRLQDKVAVITGAGTGMGRAMAMLFAKEGARVAVLSRTAANVDRTVRDIVDAGGAAMGITIDISDAPAIKPAIDRVVETLGPVDILVNNAHDVSTVMSHVIDLGDAQLQRQFDVGPFAYLHFMQACYPHMAGRYGRVINFASCTGVSGDAGYTPYVMAKEAVRGLTRVAAREWGGEKITVNCILPIAVTPGFTANSTQEEIPLEMPVLPIPRFGSPEEDVAPVALFLASADAQYMTGYCMMVDGGHMIDAGR